MIGTEEIFQIVPVPFVPSRKFLNCPDPVCPVPKNFRDSPVCPAGRDKRDSGLSRRSLVIHVDIHR